MTRALIVVDVQNDFCEGGTLPVPGAALVALEIAALIRRWCDEEPAAKTYGAVVATLDHHVDPGDHFADRPDFRRSWPRHCVAGSPGSAFHPNLDPQPFDAVFRKGEHAAAYSGFEATTPSGVGLADWLHGHGATDVDVCGLATDYCVRATALDAVAAGFRAAVLTDLVAAVAPTSGQAALTELQRAGVRLIRSPLPSPAR